MFGHCSFRFLLFAVVVAALLAGATQAETITHDKNYPESL